MHLLVICMSSLEKMPIQFLCPFFSQSVSFVVVVIELYEFFFLKFILFIYFWLRWVFVAARGLSLVAASGGYSSLRCTGFSLQWLLLLRSTGSKCAGFRSCGMRAQQLWLMGLVAPRHVGSSQTRARTHVPCIGRWILNHCATREACMSSLYILDVDPFSDI